VKQKKPSVASSKKAVRTKMPSKDTLDIKERLARMEERQVQLYSMVEQSLSSFADLSNRVSSLEALKHKALGMIAIIGGLMTLAWELVKETLIRKG
jgi:hypothetical protein